LNQWKQAVGFDEPRALSNAQVSLLSQALAPKSAVAIDGSLRRLAGYVNLELQTPRQQRYHRVYKGSHPARRDRVVLHLYDLSASDDANAEASNCQMLWMTACSGDFGLLHPIGKPHPGDHLH